jgi:Amt family ammonium transporter
MRLGPASPAVALGMFGVLCLILYAAPVLAADEPAKPPTLEELKTALDTKSGELKFAADTIWVMVTAMLVFFMNLGFACVESGFCRAKNAVNILSKNFIVFAATSIGFWFLGWGLMFGGGEGDSAKYIGQQGVLMVGGADNSPATGDAYTGDYGAINWTGVPLWAKFFFQLVFAGTAATIVSGAVAERIKYHSFILFSFIMAMAIYPVVGHWIWGGGWLAADWNFFDFAGSTQVHSIGGWAALTGAIILGPRIGKYGPGGKINAVPGHNFTAATIGCFVLWFGWFGFNPGSTMAADGNAIAEIAVTTNSAAAAATLTATLTAWILLGKPDLGMTLNGCLAGLVAITAPCAFVTVGSAVVIGGIAGVLVVLAVLMFDRLRVDDPVGATSVHLVNGIFGTLCVGIFAEPTRVAARCVPPANTWKGLLYGGGLDQLIGQAVGIGATAVYVVVISSAAWLLLKYTVGIRVPREEELAGLDIGEHGNEAYHGFVMAADQVTEPAEPRPASIPPDGGERFSIVVEGVSNGDLMHAWNELCQPGAKPEFKNIYTNVTTVQGNRFRFRGGDPEKTKASLERILRDQMRNSSLRTRVEAG